MATAGSSILSTTQVAERLGIDPSHVRRLAIRHDIGRKLSERVRVFSDRDVEALRAHLKPGMGRPKTR